MRGLLPQGIAAHAARSDGSLALPHPRQLAALGAVLCLYRPVHGSEVAGWSQAVWVEAQVGVESDGLRESFRFFDRQGRCCWRIFLLPDSDFMAWELLLASLPRGGLDVAEPGIGERLWQGLARRLAGDSWHARVVRLRALPSPTVLAASMAPVSALGKATARGIARAAGVEMEVGADECCCALAARAGQPGRRVGPSLPLIRSSSHPDGERK